MEKKDKSGRYIALDFETLDYWRATVIEIGVVVIENNKIGKRYHFYVCPPSKNEAYHCVQTHGMHYSDVKDEPDFKTVWEKVDKVIDGCPIIAHNVGFEKSCINACNEEFGTNNDYEYIDTLSLSRKYFNKLPNHKLDTVCEKIGHDLKHHHRADEDALACAKIFIKINKKHNLYD